LVAWRLVFRIGTLSSSEATSGGRNKLIIAIDGRIIVIFIVILIADVGVLLHSYKHQFSNENWFSDSFHTHTHMPTNTSSAGEKLFFVLVVGA